jgi:hypothetical protein
MNCHNAQNLISAYLDCELDAELKRELRKHLFSCPECDAVYTEMQQLKNCMENLEQAGPEVDCLGSLYMRLTDEKHVLVKNPVWLIWGPRVIITAACIGLFFFSALKFFPMENHNDQLVQIDHPDSSNDAATTFDRNFSFDQSVTVYQASVILP